MMEYGYPSSRRGSRRSRLRNSSRSDWIRSEMSFLVSAPEAGAIRMPIAAPTAPPAIASPAYFSVWLSVMICSAPFHMALVVYARDNEHGTCQVSRFVIDINVSTLPHSLWRFDVALWRRRHCDAGDTRA